VTLLLVLALQASGEEGMLQRFEREVSSVVARVRSSVVPVLADGVHLSGIVWDRKGHVITADSGIDGARDCRVVFGRRLQPASVVGRDRRSGVAVLKAESVEGEPPAVAAQAPDPGATAILVGNAWGQAGSVALGTVSGSERSILVDGRKVENLLQCALAAQPGDGGAFVADSSGRLIGLLHSAGPSDGTSRPSATSYAVTATWVRFAADRIIKHGRMVRGWLGASLMPLVEEARIRLGLPAGEGAEVARVERDSPARRAGLEVRDVLLRFDGAPVADLSSLQWKIASYEGPARVRVAYWRDGERREAELTVEPEPER
jgi:serine protease Do